MLISEWSILFVLAKSHVIFFPDVSPFSVILGKFAKLRHSTSFDTIPQEPPNKIRISSSHVGACSDEVW